MNSDELYYFKQSGSKMVGPNPIMEGDCSDLRGNCSGMSGNCSGLSGLCSNIWGDVSRVSGDCSKIWGDCSESAGKANDVQGWVGNEALGRTKLLKRRAAEQFRRIIGSSSEESELLKIVKSGGPYKDSSLYRPV